MMRTGSRTVHINKAKLIGKIRENKANHIVEYDKAVIAYKQEALKQLAKLNRDVENGEMEIMIDLVTPVNACDNYDKIIEMFN